MTNPTQVSVARLSQRIHVGLYVQELIIDDTKISCLDDTLSYGEGADGQLAAESGGIW